MNIKRIAYLHFDFISQTTDVNIKQIITGIKKAKEFGANWVVTPETAVQGYHFAHKGRLNEVPNFIEDLINPIMNAANENSVNVFAGCASKDKKGALKNSCFYINEKGEIAAVHDKKRVIVDKWAEAGDRDDVFYCGEIKTGLLICADIYKEENSAVLKEMGAKVIIVPSAWPSGYSNYPEKEIWKKASKLLGEIPILICNQTGGDEWLNYSNADSAILQNGNILMLYHGEPAILFMDIDFNSLKIMQNDFTVYPVKAF